MLKSKNKNPFIRELYKRLVAIRDDIFDGSTIMVSRPSILAIYLDFDGNLNWLLHCLEELQKEQLICYIWKDDTFMIDIIPF